MDDIYENCFSCNFLNALYENYMQFAIALYRDMAGGLLAVFGVLIAIWFSHIMWMGLAEDDLMDRLKKARRVFMALPVVVTLLMSGPITDKDTIPLVHSWIIMPMEQGAGEMGLNIIETANEIGTTSSLREIMDARANAYSGNPSQAFVVEIEGEKIVNNYALMAYGIERSVWHIISLAISFMDDSIKSALAGLLLALPYLFVLGIFAAFMTEAMFSFLSMSLFAPFAIYCFLFPMLRPIGVASLRINFGAFLTIIFAAGAMGFSIAVVDKLGTQYAYNSTMREAKTDERNAAINDKTRYCGTYRRNSGTVNYDSKKCEAAMKEIRIVQAELDAMIKAAELSDEYLVLLLMGFVSLLLHLKSKTLASNLSGAQDGAGPAAATVAGMKAATLGALMYGGRGTFGQEGALSQGMGLPMSGQSGGGPMGMRQGFRQGGLMGGARAAMQNLGLGQGGGQFGSMTPDDYAAQMSTGGGGGGQSGGGGSMGSQPMRLAPETITELSQAFSQAMGSKESGSDHYDRDGK